MSNYVSKHRQFILPEESVSPIQRAVHRMRTDPRFTTVGAALAKMRIKADRSISTAATDGTKNIIYNPEYILRFDTLQCVALLIHEMLHKHWKFFVRYERWARLYPNRDRKHLLMTFNRAQDYLINWYIRHRFMLELWPTWLYEAKYTPDKYTVERLASDLLKEDDEKAKQAAQAGDTPEQPCNGGGGDSGPAGQQGSNQPDQPPEDKDDEDAENKDEEKEGDGDGEGDGNGKGKGESEGDSEPKPEPGEGPVGEGNDMMLPEEYKGDINTPLPEQVLREMEGDLREDAADAMRMAKAAGNLTQGTGAGSCDPFAEDFEKMYKPTFDFKRALMQFARLASKVGRYSWFRTNTRRRTAQGIAMPRKHGRKMGTVVFGIDSSGSCDDNAVRYYVDEIAKALKELDYETALVIWCDAYVQKVFTFTKEEIDGGTPMFNGVRYGCGGTSFPPVFEWLAENCPDVTCITYLTDGGVGVSDVTDSERICKLKLRNPPVLYLVIDEGYSYSQHFMDMVHENTNHKAALLPSRLWKKP